MKRELLTDNHFERGFFLENPDASTHDRRVDKELHFARSGVKPCWYMAQWWTPFNFKDSPIRKTGDNYVIENPSRRYTINPKTGAFEMALDSALEYEALYHDVRHSPATPWSHFLIEQDFAQPADAASIVHLWASLSFTITKVVSVHPETFDPQIHAAQLLWYLTINEKADAYSPTSGNFIWFGLPLYDNRTSVTPFGAFLDVGNPGSTNRLIYNLSSSDYFPLGVEIGKTYHLRFDVWPEMIKAILYAREHGVFSKDSRLFVNYMNFGWELPGACQIDSFVNSLSLEVEEK